MIKQDVSWQIRKSSWSPEWTESAEVEWWKSEEQIRNYFWIRRQTIVLVLEKDFCESDTTFDQSTVADLSSPQGGHLSSLHRQGKINSTALQRVSQIWISDAGWLFPKCFWTIFQLSAISRGSWSNSENSLEPKIIPLWAN